MTTHDEPNKGYKLLIDNQPHNWPQAVISEAEIRHLGSLPGADVVDLFHKVPGKGDVKVLPGTNVDLAKQAGTDHFSSMAIGSHSGAC